MDKTTLDLFPLPTAEETRELSILLYRHHTHICQLSAILSCEGGRDAIEGLFTLAHEASRSGDDSAMRQVGAYLKRFADAERATRLDEWLAEEGHAPVRESKAENVTHLTAKPRAKGRGGRGRA